MGRKTYEAALEEVLVPRAFAQERPDWIYKRERFWARTHGEMRESVHLQLSQSLGTTVTLATRNLGTNALLAEAMPSKHPALGAYYSVRLGQLMDGKDRWWRNDPNGPSEVAEAISLHLETFFEQWRSLEAQARLFGRESAAWSNSALQLAMTLHRMGETEEACEKLKSPKKYWLKGQAQNLEDLRKWLGCTDCGPTLHD